PTRRGLATRLGDGMARAAARASKPALVGLIVSAVALVAGGAWYPLAKDFFARSAAPRLAMEHETAPLEGPTLSGMVRLSGPAGESPDAGALVLAWNTAKEPDPLLSSIDILRHVNHRAGCPFQQQGVYAARTERDGAYRLQLGEPGTYQILMIGSTAAPQPTLDAAQHAKLQRWLSDPQTLIGLHPCDIRTMTVESDVAEINGAFAAGAP
ncbi:MAG: hypothetical protein KDA41_16065, partial [Planctomycetales bacterium]|nr:hypothetical protein [Planctomycetales bacterium]